MKTLKSLIILFVMVVVAGGNISAQDSTAVTQDNRPVRSPFQTNILIDNPTVVSPLKDR